jgi:hypothetical protein
MSENNTHGAEAAGHVAIHTADVAAAIDGGVGVQAVRAMDVSVPDTAARPGLLARLGTRRRRMLAVGALGAGLFLGAGCSTAGSGPEGTPGTSDIVPIAQPPFQEKRMLADPGEINHQFNGFARTARAILRSPVSGGSDRALLDQLAQLQASPEQIPQHFAVTEVISTDAETGNPVGDQLTYHFSPDTRNGPLTFVDPVSLTVDRGYGADLVTFGTNIDASGNTVAAGADRGVTDTRQLMATGDKLFAVEHGPWSIDSTTATYPGIESPLPGGGINMSESYATLSTNNIDLLPVPDALNPASQTTIIESKDCNDATAATTYTEVSGPDTLAEATQRTHRVNDPNLRAAAVHSLETQEAYYASLGIESSTSQLPFIQQTIDTIGDPAIRGAAQHAVDERVAFYTISSPTRNQPELIRDPRIRQEVTDAIADTSVDGATHRDMLADGYYQESESMYVVLDHQQSTAATSVNTACMIQ